MALTLKSGVQELKQIPFDVLIGAPLTAAIKSQALAAQTTIDFIKEVGFKPAVVDPAVTEYDPIDRSIADETTVADIGDVRNVTFKYSKKDETDTEKDFSLTVPILAIVPIPYIRIDEMTIDFKAKLTDSVTSRNTSEASADITMSAKYGAFFTPVKVSVRASASYKTTSTNASAQKREYQMDIHVRAIQDEMPAGLSKILDILEDAIKNEPVAAPVAVP